MKERHKILDKLQERLQKSLYQPPSIHCIDLFCGVGGLTHGLLKGGVKVIAGIDIDPECKFPYETNNHTKFINQDIDNLEVDHLKDLFATHQLRLLAGCSPCQPFSTYSQKGRQNSNDDDKWNLVSKFGCLAHDLQPELITMENVPQLTTHSVFQKFLDSISNYNIWWEIIRCVDYGIPQTRKRLVLLASKIGPVRLLNPSQFSDIAQINIRDVTVRNAIKHLPPLSAGMSDPNDILHTACSLSELNLLRIKASKPGGTWRDWDISLIAECHRKQTGQTYPSVYGRMEWDTPSPTITTQCFGFGNGRFGHPEQDRAISLREAAILQTFPTDYQFIEDRRKLRFSKLGRLIGNAVPVRLGEVIATSLRYYLRQKF
jgi:DNA (cytosine-5)-methyltransferase 1